MAWSSSASFMAVDTLTVLDIISAFSSLHLDISLFSFSWDFCRALATFSYSTRNFSNFSSPNISFNTSWMSFSKVSKVLSSV